MKPPFIKLEALPKIIILLLLIAGCFKGSENTSETFTNETGGYSLDYPSGWLAFELPDGQQGEKEVTGIVVMVNQDSPNIYIRQTFQNSPSLKDAVEWGEKRLFERYSELGILQFESLNYSEMNGMEVAKRTYTISFPDQEAILKNQDVYIATSKNMFIVTFSSTVKDFDYQIEVFDEIISSFQINENP